jgi:hypothetical protein
MKKLGLVIVFIIVIVLVWQLYPTEKRKLTKDIKDLKKAFETESTAEVVKYIDHSYQDIAGMNYEEITAAITQFFVQVDSIKVQMSGLKPNIDSTGHQNQVFASCSLGLRVMARFEGERVLAFGGIVHPASVRALFKKSDGYYRIYYAQY